MYSIIKDKNEEFYLKIHCNCTCVYIYPFQNVKFLFPFAVLSFYCYYGDLLFVGHDRNDVYVTLEYGQFEKGSKMAERNVEVAIAVCNSEGRIVPV